MTEEKERFKQGWLEALGWINGEINLCGERITKQKMKEIIEKWIDEWENSIYFRNLPD